MKKQLKFSGAVLIAVLAMVSCETEEDDLLFEDAELKKGGHGIARSYDNGVVLKWNEAVSLTVDNKMPPPPESKAYAMVMLAIHDALNTVAPRYETYALDNFRQMSNHFRKGNLREVADAAVSQAAHDVLSKVSPLGAQVAAPLLAECLGGITDPDALERGVTIGKEAAAAILSERAGDPPVGFAAYPQGPDPGQYRSPVLYVNPGPAWPANAAFGANLGQLKPFGVKSSSQFRADPPPDLQSPLYAADYNEVKAFGGEGSTQRTPAQTEMGLFFIDNVANSINRVLRILAVRQRLDGWETARMMALVHMAQFDAVQSSFEGKYHYNRWRPETAIALGDIDGNPQTAGDPGWIILKGARATPPTPTYPSTHASAAGAVAEVLKLYFKRDNIPFSIGSYTLPGVERSFSGFSQFARECSVSRIYIGYHFRQDIVIGEKMGRKLGQYVYFNNLRPIYGGGMH